MEYKLGNDNYELEISIGHSIYVRNNLTNKDAYILWENIKIDCSNTVDQLSTILNKYMVTFLLN